MTVTEIREWTHEGRPELRRRGVTMPDGPWVAEPDKRHWVDAATGLDCLMLRNGIGAWCGYVAVTEGHPYFEVGYSECAEKDGCDGGEWGYCDHSPDARVRVHGGLTYADFCRESNEGEGHGICHVPFDGRPERVWWLGFDTAHGGDLSPYDVARGDDWPIRGDVYRDVAYVEGECRSLARQLAAVSQ